MKLHSVSSLGGRQSSLGISDEEGFAELGFGASRRHTSGSSCWEACPVCLAMCGADIGLLDLLVQHRAVCFRF